MKPSEYKINSKQSAEEFERKLRIYCEARKIRLDSLGLSEAYLYLTMPCFDHRCFSAYLDLCLQDIALQQDINILWTKTNCEVLALTTDGFSENRMDRYIASSNAAHRIRAMWDKIMGFIILLEHPASYEEFVNSKSRLSAFKRVHAKWIRACSNESEELISFLSGKVDRISDNVTSISDNFRTSEAHSVGRLSKWAFAKQVDEDDPFEIMVDNYNEVRDHMYSLVTSIYFKVAFSRNPPFEAS